MISNQNLEEMDYQESLKYEDWKNERGWADLIMRKVYDLQLNVGLDKLTRGRGDCLVCLVSGLVLGLVLGFVPVLVSGLVSDSVLGLILNLISGLVSI